MDRSPQNGNKKALRYQAKRFGLVLRSDGLNYLPISWILSSISSERTLS
jgi:hypothetical protein